MSRRFCQTANVIVVDSTDTDLTGATQAITRFKLILEKRGSDWHIVAGQNTRVLAHPDERLSSLFWISMSDIGIYDHPVMHSWF
jgi:hypothetical protein